MGLRDGAIRKEEFRQRVEIDKEILTKKRNLLVSEIDSYEIKILAIKKRIKQGKSRWFGKSYQEELKEIELIFDRKKRELIKLDERIRELNIRRVK